MNKIDTTNLKKNQHVIYLQGFKRSYSHLQIPSGTMSRKPEFEKPASPDTVAKPGEGIRNLQVHTDN